MVAVAVLGAVAVPASAAAGSQPSVLRESATHIEQTDARLNARVDPGGLETHYEVWLVDPCPEPQECIQDLRVAAGTLRATETAKAIHVDLATSEEHPNIEPGTTYEYWVDVSNAAGSDEGLHQTFKTLPVGTAPVVVRESASKITEQGARLSARINPGALPSDYAIWIADPCPPPLECIRDVLLKHGTLRATTDDLSVHVETSSAEEPVILEPSTRYEYWVEAGNGAGATEGPRQTFTTFPS